MERHLVIILIAFFSGIFAYFLGPGEYRQGEPCASRLMEFGHTESAIRDRIVAGFYKKSFFYFVHGNDRKIELDPKTLFGEIGIPATATYTINRLVPVNGNRVIIFFEQSDKLFYAFYELDDLTKHAKNGSARVLQSLHSQEKHEAKFVGGCDVRKEEFGRTMKRDNDKLVLGVKKLQGIDLTFCNSRFDIVFDRYSYTGTMSFYVNAEDEGKNEECSHSVRQEKNAMLTCINGQTVDFDLVLVNYRRDFRHYDHSEIDCTFATGAREDFTYVQVLPTDFKINHASSGYGATTTTSTTTTSTTTTTTTTTSTTTTTTTTSPTPCSGSSIRRSWTVFLPVLIIMFVPLIIVPSS